jgi:hypothetical protein
MHAERASAYLFPMSTKTLKPSNSTVHPFFDKAKGCRKTAWDTPEHLSEKDWQIVGQMIAALEREDELAFHVLVTASQDVVFNRILGWPEGRAYYCYGSQTAREFYFPGFTGRDLPQLKAAFAVRHGELFAAA